MTQTLPQELEQLEATEFDAGLVFSGAASGNMVRGYSSPCSCTPVADSTYIFMNRHEMSWSGS